MIGRFFLAVIFIISIAWLFYVGTDILNVKSNFSEEQIFSAEDKKVLIVNRPDEVRFDFIKDFSNSPLFDVLKKLNSDEYRTAFVSFERPQMLLKRDENWKGEDIKSLFSTLDEKITFDGASFSIGELNGEFFKKKLYLSKGEIENNYRSSINISYDNKSSASIVEIKDDNTVNSVSDIYFNTEEKVEGRITRFKTVKSIAVQGKKIKDEVIFAPVVSKNFTSYHFYERDYFASKDSVFANGPMSKWTQDGFVEIVYNGKKAFISDYIGGQDPLLVLNDLTQTQDEYQFSIPLMNNFPGNGTTYFVKYLADFVVISSTEIVCDQLIADYKLGKTIALNPTIVKHVYGNLPKSVSERFVSEDISYSRSVFQNYIMETQLEGKKLIAKSNKKETQTVNCNFDILDFNCLKKDGEIAVLSKENEIAFIQDGEIKWKKALNEKCLSEVQVIDLYSNNELFILVNTESKIHLFNRKGEYSSGFPISLNSEATNEVKFYRWKGKSYFIIATNNGRVNLFDGKGRELNVFKSQQIVTKKINVWASQNKLFAGLSNDEFFEMYNLEKIKTHRDFILPTSMWTAKIPNELIQFGIEDGYFIKIDQKGTKYKYQQINNAKIIKVEQNFKNPIVIVQKLNEILLFNSEGFLFGAIKIPFNEVDDVTVLTNSSGKTYVSILDGLENNVYLYSTNGELVKKSLEGQTKVQLHSYSNRTRLTTVIDQFIVQYFN